MNVIKKIYYIRYYILYCVDIIDDKSNDNNVQVLS